MMRSHALCAFFAIGGGVPVGEPRALPPGEPIAIEVSGAEGLSLFLVAPAAGEVLLWALSEELDPRLTATVAGADAREDDDGGGGDTAFLRLDVAADDRVDVQLDWVGAENGRVTAAAFLVPALDESRTVALERLRAALDGVDADHAALTSDALALSTGQGGGFEGPALLVSLVRDIAVRATRSGRADVAQRSLRELLAFEERVLPASHLDLAQTRKNLAVVLENLGELDAAVALRRRHLDGLRRFVTVDHPERMAALEGLARALRERGDLLESRDLFEELLEVRTASGSHDDVDLQWARIHLSTTLRHLGDLDRAEDLLLAAEAALSAGQPAGDRALVSARGSLAVVRFNKGDVRGAHDVLEHLLVQQSETMSPDDLDMLKTRQNLGIAKWQLGDLEGARDLFLDVLRSYRSRFPSEHFAVVDTQTNLAIVLRELGRLTEARALEERNLDVCLRTLAEDHPRVQRVRSNLAVTLSQLGDDDRARELQQRALEVWSRQLADDHRDLQSARLILAAILSTQQEHEEALALCDKVLEVFARTLPDDHPEVQAVRMTQAGIHFERGELEAALELYEAILAAYESGLGATHLQTLHAKQALAMTLWQMGEEERAARLFEETLSDMARTLPDEHPALAGMRGLALHAFAVLGPQSEGKALALASEQAAGLRAALRAAAVESAPREAEALATSFRLHVSRLLSLVTGRMGAAARPELLAPTFELTQTMRGIGLTSARVAWATRSSEARQQVARLRHAIRTTSAEIARLVGREEARDEWLDAVRRKEVAERQLREPFLEAGTGIGPPIVEPEELARRLRPTEAAVAYWSYRPSSEERALDCGSHGDELFAFVLRADGSLRGVELGRIEAVANAWTRWRLAAVAARDARGIGVETAVAEPFEEAGRRLRELLLDPLESALEGTKRVYVAPDDLVHGIPLDALPLDAALTGDRRELVYLVSLSELPGALAGSEQPTALVAIGDLEYRPMEDGGATEPREAPLLRGYDSGFRPLPGTRFELDAIAALHRETVGSDQEIIRGAEATPALLGELAPGARYLHLATHGWFAPDSVPAVTDPIPLDAFSGLGRRSSLVEAVRGLSPLALCGLALSRANDSTGIGVITAEELAQLDLSGCELAVLSACDTGVGLRRAGVGIASMQTALHAAGVRTAITSLWQVDDTATRLLMTEFYRRLWVEGDSAGRALWGAKAWLRRLTEAEARGRLTAPEQDRLPPGEHPYAHPGFWAGWVLTGDPD